ncbi:hypothetical protein EVAR_38197_1 [Eumeta japonica]|uniref:Uncharacterized protein n=1 Tax=Eumeta variegata TaxID=151549 RepID=A0A4C1WGC0_EUMVA|nr:hypothetical protein EVAR_38197_1 [Eumeta japonica]
MRSRVILWSTWLLPLYFTGRAILLKYHTLTEYGCDAAASAIALGPVSNSFDDLLSSHPSSLSGFPSIRYSIPSQVVSNALVTLLGL